MSRRPSPPPTRPPPPPDPLDAADHFLERAQRHAAEFRYSEDDEPSTATGQQHPINLTVNLDRTSSHEIAPVPAAEDHGRRTNTGGLAAAIIVLASSLAAICKALGWL